MSKWCRNLRAGIRVRIIATVLLVLVGGTSAGQESPAKQVLVAAASQGGGSTRPPAGPLWPGTEDGRHRYLNGFFPFTWRAPQNWDDGSAEHLQLLDDLARYDVISLGEPAGVDWAAFAAALKSRNPRQLHLVAIPWQRIWDYGNGARPRQVGDVSGPRLGLEEFQALYPNHIARLAPDPSGDYAAQMTAWGLPVDIALSKWGADSEYIINWWDDAVPAIMANVVANYLQGDHPTFRPDGVWFDWVEFPGDGWWIQAGNGHYVDGDNDNVATRDDTDERLATFANWLEFLALFRDRMGDDFLITCNYGGQWNPFVPTATASDGTHLASGFDALIYEHFPYFWGDGLRDLASAYVREALESDDAKRLGHDSFLDWHTGAQRPASEKNRHTSTRGYLFLLNSLQINSPYVSILSLLKDGAVAIRGPYPDRDHHVAYGDPWTYPWSADPCENLKELGAATGPARKDGNVWSRSFDHGVVQLVFNAHAVLPNAPPDLSRVHPPNPAGPFRYLVEKNPTTAHPDTLQRGGGWPRQ